MVATSIEQSKKLFHLGLDPKTADMYYTGHRSIFNPKEIEYTQEPRVRAKFVSFDRLEVFFPAWSLSALLEVMPKENEPALVKSLASGQYFVHGYFGLEKSTYMTKDYIQPIDAAYEMVRWLLKKEIIKKQL